MFPGPPRLAFPRGFDPVKLRRETVEAERKAKGKAELHLNREAREEALEYLDSYIRGDIKELPPRRILRVLVGWYGSTDEDTRRDSVLIVALQSPDLTWRRLWSLWENTALSYDDEIRSILIDHLQKRLSSFIADRPKSAGKRLPRWLPMTDWVLRDALNDPREAVNNFAEENQVALTDFFPAFALSPSSNMGIGCIWHLIRTGDNAWWRAQGSDHEIRVWASNRAGFVAAAVAERQLLEYGADASGPAQVMPNPSLITWIEQEVGTPERHPDIWAIISDDARRIYEWILIHENFEKILAEFGRHAERARKDFWECYYNCIGDAFFYQAYDTAVCMMKFNDHLFIEFGTTGNACYVYEAPNIWFRQLSIPGGRSASYFKNLKTGIKLGGEHLPFIRKFNHSRDWQWNFSEFLRHDAGITSSHPRSPICSEFRDKQKIIRIENGAKRSPF